MSELMSWWEWSLLEGGVLALGYILKICIQQHWPSAYQKHKRNRRKW